MKTIHILVLESLLCGATFAFASDLQPLSLPPPRTDAGRPLMQVLKDRKSSREFSRESLPLQVLSDLLWAGFGVNRPATGHRTAPSAMNSQEIDLYVAMANGVFLFDALNHRLMPVSGEDVRSKTGGQPFAQEAPLALIFVADFAKTPKMKANDRDRYAAIDTGYISQNIYLYCASEGLATVVHELSERDILAKALLLRSDQRIILAQSVGLPKPIQSKP